MFTKNNVFNRSEPPSRREPAGGAASSYPVSSGSPPVNPPREAAASVTPPPPVPASDASLVASPQSLRVHSPPAAKSIPARESLIGDKANGARLHVGPDVKLKGAEILDCDILVVEGRVEATMDSRVVRIAESGSFVGKVSIDIAEIHGNFEGELTARSQLIIHSTGRVSGKIRYGKLVVDEGGEICGEVTALAEAAASRARPVLETLVAVSAVAG